MTRQSGYLLPTEKEAPADAEATSHKLMVRAGLVRQLGAGMWSYLPAGWRAHRRVERDGLALADGEHGRMVEGPMGPAQAVQEREEVGAGLHRPAIAEPAAGTKGRTIFTRRTIFEEPVFPRFSAQVPALGESDSANCQG